LLKSQQNSKFEIPNSKLEKCCLETATIVQCKLQQNKQGLKMDKFGDRIRELRNAKGYSLRQLAPLVGVGFSYLSKVENGKLDFDGSASESLIHRLADVLEADEEELLLLAEKVPEPIRRRVIARPDAFRRLAELSDRKLDRVLASLD
jgi:transcriptional regulator with XRE-family HTH domain